jgi:hypothetical protein
MKHMLCETCGAKYAPPGRRELFAATDYEPAEWGRVIVGAARHPQMEQRYMRVNDEVFPMSLEHYDCDQCNRPIRPGDPACCVTVWRTNRPEPPEWESGFIGAEAL